MCGLFICCLGKKMNFTAASQTLSKNFFSRCLSFILSLSLSPSLLPQIQFPNRCHLLWGADIFWKILVPELYRPCMLLKHKGNRLLLGSPSSEFPAEPLESSQPPCLPWAVPPGSEQLRTLAGSVVLYMNSAAARSGCRDCCLTGDVLASRGPSRWVPRHCSTPLLASKEEWAKGVKGTAHPKEQISFSK